MTPTQPRPGYILDTSVVLKWFVEEEEADVPIAWQLQEAYLDGKCILRAPDLLLFELANALKAGRRFKTPEVLKALEYVRGLNLDLEPFDWTTLAKSVEIASLCDAPVCDSYFLAMAVESDSILITADEVFLRKARRYPRMVSLRQLRLPT